jgi:ribosomal protein S18 acetylase RimI-like enzyme
MHDWTLSTEGSSEDRVFVRLQLRAYNCEQLPDFFDMGDSDPQVAVYARDENGQIVGGIVGEIHWTTVVIDHLWAAESQRGRGLGSALLRGIEAEGARLGCTSAYVTTFDFQAPAFYQRFGYRLIGQLDDYPPGHTLYMLRRFF